ncbi:DUF2147 domain-containing protein [Geobacter sp. SVR]|uniref:DUF2147 domain-containing protein n=1 Tax=Geobacter sp. SVR TaxID=2495594 RepID=UPI00143EFFF0|nr:DUF2147 domain-containing protein [Geobacter sp. SVR]BCS53584.1 hypothetical protein GSVR_18920 [Geobacter sp. SVR]GCF84219.1 hypothetical protein GSbR_08190 [Geobacter sp. SVR]
MNASQAIVRGTVAAWLLLASAPVQAAGAGTILGEWYTEGDESRVEIYECGAELCGRIVWLKTPNYSDSKDGPIGTPILDSRNPDPSLRERPVNGLRIMQGFRQEEEATWGGGTVYDPKSGRTYRGTIRMARPDRLELRGYVGIPLFGRTSEWRR